jgi:dolichyl-phosphate beta-glucosyltransferase
MPSVSIIIPAYNEEKRLPGTLSRVKKFLSAAKIRAEIIVVDDGSSDGTAALVKKEKSVKLVSNKINSGKGFSIKRGALAAKRDIVLFTDADLSTPIAFLKPFMREHAAGVDVVVASRDIAGSKVKVPQNIFRETAGKIFNLFVRAITGLPIHDTQCGFKSFTRKAAREIFSRQTIPGFGFDAEALFIAKKHGLKIREYPVEWYNSPATKVSFFTDSLRMFAELFKIRFNDLKGLYK